MLSTAVETRFRSVCRREALEEYRMGDPIVAFPLSSLGTVMPEPLRTEVFATIVYAALALALIIVAVTFRHGAENN